MTVKEFLQNYGGNECVSIEGYCEEEHYDYFREADEWELSDDNPNHYKPTCIAKESWWNEVKDREIKECIKSNYGLIWRNRRGKKED